MVSSLPVAPGPRGLPITGNLWWVRRDSLGFLLAARARYGDLLRLRMGHLVIHVVSSPAGVKHVLKTAQRTYVRTTPTNARLIDIIGRSLLTTDGKEWEERRKVIAPLMTPRASSAPAQANRGVSSKIVAINSATPEP